MVGIAASSKHWYLLAFAILASWFHGGLGALEAQVTIEERVEIRSTDVASQKAVATVSETNLIAPFDGILHVEYLSADRLISFIPPTARLDMEVNGVSFASDTVTNRVVFVDSSFILCDGDFGLYEVPWWGTRMNYAVIPDPPPAKAFATSTELSTWTAGEVSGGDSVVFDYQGNKDGETYATGLVQVDSVTWTLEGGALACWNHGSAEVYWSDRVRAEVRIARDTLTIEIDDPKEVWPSIPNSGWQSKILNEVKNVLSPITVTVTENGSPVASQEIELAMSWVDTSGGHVHAQPAVPNAIPRPIPKGIPHLIGSSLGSLGLLTGTLISSSDSTVVATTDQNGEISVSYTAGEFGGRVAFAASTTIGGHDVIVADTVTIKVPNLTMLPDVPQTEYKKLGGTLNHPGPDDDHFGNDFVHDPDYNHWVRVDVLPKIQEIASEWLSSEDKVLWINDMSLVNGGDFDISGTWTGSHKQHRVGRDIDIKTTTLAEGDGVYVSADTLADGSPYYFSSSLAIGNRLFEDTVVFSCGDFELESRPLHYHIRFYPDTMNNCE